MAAAVWRVRYTVSTDSGWRHGLVTVEAWRHLRATFERQGLVFVAARERDRQGLVVVPAREVVAS